MNTQTFVNRIKGVAFRRNSDRINKAYMNAIITLGNMAKGEKIHPFTWEKGRGSLKLKGEREMLIMEEMLRSAKVRLNSGNDAPRQGKQGDFFYLTPNERRKLRGIDFNYIISNY